MKNKNKHTDKEAINKLPEIIPDKNLLWERIDKKILVDDLYNEKKRIALHKAIKSLPDIVPDQDIWHKIEPQLNDSKQITLTLKRFGHYAAAIAAIVIMVIIFKVKPTINKITYSKEILEENSKSIDNNNTEQTKDLILKLCSVQPTRCKNPDFEKLKSELDYLIKEKQKISQSNEIYISNPEKSKYNEFLNKQIEDLTDRIIDYLSI